MSAWRSATEAVASPVGAGADVGPAFVGVETTSVLLSLPLQATIAAGMIASATRTSVAARSRRLIGAIIGGAARPGNETEQTAALGAGLGYS